MAQYPDNPYTPREIENIPGVTYDANQKKKFYAEDLNAVNDEIVELEDRLTPFTDKPLPFGIRSGDSMSWLQTFVQNVDGVDIPLIGSAILGGAIFYPMIQGSFLPILSLSGEDPVLVFAQTVSGDGAKLQYAHANSALYLIGNDDETKIDFVVSKDLYAERLFLGTDLPIAQGGTGKGAFTAGQILFGEFAQSADLFWDDTNKRLGLGTENPLTALHVAHNDGILAVGALGSGWDGGSLGASTRLMWIPSKGAFRVGTSMTTWWNTSEIGNNSFACGVDTKAKGNNSIAMVNSSQALASFSVAIGLNAYASSSYSFAIGQDTNSHTNQHSFSIGYGAESAGTGAISIGHHTVATAPGAFSAGYYSEATAGQSVAIGAYAKATVSYSVAIGRNVTASTTTMAMAFGYNFTNTVGSSFAVGFGQKDFEVRSGKVILPNPTVPTTIGSAGIAGEIAWSSTHFYVCVATNSWKRVALSTW